MSCINCPSNYRVIMETNGPTITEQPPPAAVQPLPPVQCSCQRIFQQQQQHPHHPLQQQQQQQQHQQRKPQPQTRQQQSLLYQQQQQQHRPEQPLEQLVTCFHHQPAEQSSANSRSSPQDSQNSQASTATSAGAFCKSYYPRSTSESGGQLSCRCPFEISISSAHPPARPSYAIRLPSGMAPAGSPGRNSTSDDEFYSLSSASSDRDDCMPPSAGKGNGQNKKEITTKRDFMDCEFTSPGKEKKPKSNKNPPRNVAILQLLREVVQLINQSDENGRAHGCDVAPTKMHSIGALGSEEPVADNGPFSSGFKITFTPSRKATSPNASCAPSEMSEPQPLGQPVNIPLQLPCNLIITPNLLTCAPCPHVPACATKTPQQMQIAPTREVGTKCSTKQQIREATAEDFCSLKGLPSSCIGDLELIEEIAALALTAEPKQCTESSRSESNDVASRKVSPEECICNQPYICPVHGFYMPVVAQGETSVTRDCSQPIDEEEECNGMYGENTDIVTEPSQSQTHVSSAQSATTNATKKSDGRECSCCHCQAMRDKQNCLTIATTDQAQDQYNCRELKFFIDSIIMDLDAMDKARRKKQIEQNTTPTSAKVCS
ncbi:PREDICTED: uncharacterized protein LOC108377442, partial [Rhagoletis zephyria]|uniref:uncharacterized protein LOC108377442 n=1 Tax=Rhagoletis zephyria TaxID=28612 RepID=UPI0008117F1E